MPFVWSVECKTCLQRFAVLPREVASAPTSSGETRAKSTSALPPHEIAGTFECPHCHEEYEYANENLIPGEGRIIHK